MEKYIFKNEMVFDAETSGVKFYDTAKVNPDDSLELVKQNGIVQLTATAFIAGEKKFSYNEYMQPLKGQLVDPGALKVNGLTMEQLRGFQDPAIAFNEFMDNVGLFIDPYNTEQKFTLVGYNSRFDDDFMRQWFSNIDPSVWYGSYFRWPAVDVANLAAVYLGDQYIKMPDFKLMTVAIELGLDIDPEKAHDSAYDVDVTLRMFHFLCDKMGLYNAKH